MKKAILAVGVAAIAIAWMLVPSQQASAGPISANPQLSEAIGPCIRVSFGTNGDGGVAMVNQSVDGGASIVVGARYMVVADTNKVYLRKRWGDDMVCTSWDGGIAMRQAPFDAGMIGDAYVGCSTTEPAVSTSDIPVVPDMPQEMTFGLPGELATYLDGLSTSGTTGVNFCRLRTGFSSYK